MKRYLTLLVTVFFTATLLAQNSDYLLRKDFQSEKKKISESIDAAKKQSADARKLVTKQAVIIDSLTKLIDAHAKMIAQANDSLQKTASGFNELQTRVDKKTSTSQNSLILAVIIIAIVILIMLVLIFLFKNRSDQKLRELGEENKKLGEAIREEVNLFHAEIRKTAESISAEFHAHEAALNAKLELAQQRQHQFATELEEVVDKIVKEQNAQKSAFDSRFSEIKTALVDKTEHKAAHDKLESEVKSLRTLHVKDIEELKAKH
jgi:hypothetical protein